jgi:aryl-alcohol dehydrogenase-like predicted oxidoreductase
MTFGEEFGWGASEATSARMLDMYLDIGGNVLDTADVYTNGTSEEMLGRLLGARRERLVVSTKYSMTMRPEDPNGGGNHRRRLVEAVDASLRRLRTDRIDVLWVHFRDELTPVQETLRALDDQVRLGKVLYVAVSDWPAWEVSRANAIAELRDWSPFHALQIPYSLLQRTPERDLIPMAMGVGLSVVAWSPLARGMLTGKYLDPAATGRITATGEVSIDERTEAVLRTTIAVAEELGVTPSQVAIAWLLAQPTRVMPIVGATTEQQLADNLAALDVQLTAEQLERLDAASSIDLGFPQEWLALDVIRRAQYGQTREQIVT